MSMSGPSNDAIASKTVVLVVEDEPLLLFEAADSLEDAGFTVLTATNAAEALRALEKHKSIDVLFSDINMPGDMDGLGLAEAVHERWPNIGIILTSGHVSIQREDLPGTDISFFSKPYLTERVIVEVGRITNGQD